MRSTITETVQRVQSLVDQVKALEPDEYAFFLDLLMPEPEVETKSPSISTAPVKKRKIEKCEACNWTKRAAVHKDPNADGYHEFQAAKSSAKKSAHVSAKAAKGFCMYKPASGTVCNEVESNAIHHDQVYAGYHPFVSSSAARNAAGKSSTNGAEVNSETGSDAAMGASGD